MGTKLTILAVAISLFCGSLYGAYMHGRSTATTEIASEQAKQHNKQWRELFALQGQLATRDQQLAAAQQAAKNVRTETIIKREVIYRDRIKNVAVRDCVADSGLLDIYDATLELSDPAE